MLIIGKENIADEHHNVSHTNTDKIDLLSRYLANDKVSKTPLIRFRGEHGEIHGKGFQSRLPNISFGDYKTAREYALSPNNQQDSIHTPRVHAGYLAIQFPVIETDDPFIDLSTLIDLFGFEETKKFALKNTNHINNTNAWEEIIAEFEDKQDRDILDDSPIITEVDEFIEQYPDRMGELCLLAYVAFDDEDISRMVVDAGFDGAIHGSFGIADEGYEHKIFNEKQFVGSDSVSDFFTPEKVELLIQTRFKKFLVDGIKDKKFPIVPSIEYITKSDYYSETIMEFNPVIMEMGEIMNWNKNDYNAFEGKIESNLHEWIKSTDFKNISYLKAGLSTSKDHAKMSAEQAFEM